MVSPNAVRPATPQLPLNARVYGRGSYTQLMANIALTVTGDAGLALHTLMAELTEMGYTVTPDPGGWGGSAEVGSAVGRALLGGFSRRMKLGFNLSQGYLPNQYLVVVEPKMSGASGGAIGVSRAKKEITEVQERLVLRFAAAGQLVQTT
jgi:hypothetical protein